jgi:hypothetical protein
MAEPRFVQKCCGEMKGRHRFPVFMFYLAVETDWIQKCTWTCFFLNFQHRLQRKFNHRRLSPWMFIARYDSTSQLLRHSSRAVWVGLEWWGYHIVTTFQATQATNQLIWNLDKLERPHFDIIRVMRIALVTIPIEATISG